MSARQPVSVALWDEMRADARVVAGGEPEGGLPPASEGMPAGGLADTAGHSGAQQDRAEEAGQSSVAACLLHPNKIAVPNGPQCVPALPVGGSAAPERFLPLELLPGGAATRNATVAGQDFRVVAIPAQRCIACGNTSVMFSDCPQCAAYAKRGLRVRKCLGCMRATPLPAHRYRCDDCGGREVA